MKKDFKPKITVFCCEHSGLPSADMAVESGFVYPESVQMIKVPCSGKIESIHIMRALEEGDGVVVYACHKEACQFLKGNLRTEARLAYIKNVLKEIGIEEERVRMYYLASSNGVKFTQTLSAFYEDLKSLGLNAGRAEE